MHLRWSLRNSCLFPTAIIAVALLGACNLPDTPEPGCELIAPGIPIEDSQISDSLRPTVEWVYDGDCEPDSFRVEIAPDGDFGSASALAGTVDAATWTWTPPVSLQPMTEYGWHVAAVSDAGLVGPYSITRPLWTGPVCAGPYLWTPRLISPDTGEAVTNPSPEFRWESRQPECLIPYYKFDVSTDPSFATSVLRGGTTGPGSAFEAGVDYLIDCQTYFWRVAATAGMDLVSEYATDFFRTDFNGACGGPEESATVNGSVWRDECPASGACGAAIPAGCQCVEGSIAADGVRQPSEPGIADVKLHVHPGACPQAGFIWDMSPVTDAEGNFSAALAPGLYCFTIRSEMPYNDALGKPGWWTLPIPYDSPYFGYTVALAEGDAQTGIGFAWQPAPPGTVLGGIGGQLWRDLDGDGTLDSGEPGIDGVEVWLSSGECDPEWSNRQGGIDPTTRTEADGEFGLGSNYPDEWISLMDGDYCVVVDPNDGWFADIMGEGTWTYPVPNAEIAMTTIHLRGGQSQTGIDFGWGTPSGEAGPQIVTGPTFSAAQDLNCRLGPATVYDVIGYLLQGESAAIVGVNEEGTWVQVQNPNSPDLCWLALSGGSVEGDLSAVAVVTPPPTPVPSLRVEVSHRKGSSCGDVIITATATDKVAVTEIKIYVNGNGVKTCANATSCTYAFRPSVENVTIYATAVNVQGKVATSEKQSFKSEAC